MVVAEIMLLSGGTYLVPSRDKYMLTKLRPCSSTICKVLFLLSSIIDNFGLMRFFVKIKLKSKFGHFVKY